MTWQQLSVTGGACLWKTLLLKLAYGVQILIFVLCHLLEAKYFEIC